jgi:RNA-directed DNA polymerase
LPEKVTDLRRKLYQKAKQEPKFRFYALYDRVTRLDVLTAAWQITLAKDKGPGIDGIRCQDIIDAPGGVAAFLEQLQRSLVTRTYRPDPVKRVYIDKPDGRKRPLGIPILRDRVVQTAVLHLIKVWLRCGVVEEDANGRRQSSRPEAGTPQGGVISPLLSNIYLHWFEHLFLRRDGPAHWAKAKITRYADDFVIQARYVGTRLSGWIESVLENRFQLQINREKTKIVQLGPAGQPLDFLGYTFRYDRDLYGRRNHYLNLFPSRKALKKAREKIASLTGPERCFQPITALIAEINAWSRGWSAYFAIGYPRQAKREIFRYIAERLTRHLKRRSQRAYRPPEGTSFYAHLQALGLKRL